MTREEFKILIENKVLILDGTMGAALMANGLSPGEAPELYNTDHPEIIERIHRGYIDAGANITLTNTFGGSSIKLGEFGLADRMEELNKKAVEIALRVADGKALVGASIGPSGRYLPPIGSLQFREALNSFRDQAKAVKEAGVDLIVVETMSDIRELRACLIGIREVYDGVLISHMTFTDGFNTITGTDPETAVVVMEALDVDVVGVNCSTGPEEMESVVRVMVEATHLPVSVEPNAGIPDLIDGHMCFPALPEEMGEYSAKFVKMGANIVGGCCGCGDEHVKAIVDAVRDLKPVKRNISRKSRLASRDKTIVISPDLPTRMLGERINPTGRKQFALKIVEGDFGAVRNEADRQVKAGADIIDVNMGVPGEDEVTLMRKAVQVVQAAVNVPLSLDSANADALEAGLQEIEGKPLINSVTAEKDKLDAIIPLAKKYGAALIGLPIDEKGIPETADGRFKLGEKILKTAEQAGIPKEDIYLDGLTLAVSADACAPLTTLKTIEMFRDRLGVNTVLGVSNVSFGLPERKTINSAFLSMAIERGLTLPIVNPYSEPIVESVRLSDLLTGRDTGAQKFLASIKVRDEVKEVVEERAKAPVSDRLYDAVLFGNTDGVVPLVQEALKDGIDPMLINDEIMIPAMLEVGKRYDRKTYFLPQVIMAAETMHAAFAELRPHIPAAQGEPKGTILLATVRGDVHDIGKNIVATLVENHGYNVVDMGKNVTAIEIINKAEVVKADVIGLSALMTTTMNVMKDMVTELRSSVSAKIIVGGAVVTRRFAESIGADGYGKDAGEAVKEIERVLSE